MHRYREIAKIHALIEYQSINECSATSERKLEKYHRLREELEKMWEVKVTVGACGTLGTVGEFFQQFQEITFEMSRRAQSYEELRYRTRPSTSQASGRGPTKTTRLPVDSFSFIGVSSWSPCCPV